MGMEWEINQTDDSKAEDWDMEQQESTGDINTIIKQLKNTKKEKERNKQNKSSDEKKIGEHNKIDMRNAVGRSIIEEEVNEGKRHEDEFEMEEERIEDIRKEEPELKKNNNQTKRVMFDDEINRFGDINKKKTK